MQNGSLIETKRRSGASVWEFRWRDRTGGKAVYRLAPLSWHLATFDVATQFVLDQVLHEEGDAGASLVIVSLRDEWLPGSVGHSFFSDLAQASGITLPAFQSDELGEDAGFVAEELLGEELE
jgi:hypothetical protein